MTSTNIIEPTVPFAMAHEDLACYAIAQFPQFERPRHIELILKKLEAVEDMKRCRNLLRGIKVEMEGSVISGESNADGELP